MELVIPMSPDREHARLIMPDPFDAEDLRFIVQVLEVYCPRLTYEVLFPIKPVTQEDIDRYLGVTGRLAEIGQEEDPFLDTEALEDRVQQAKETFAEAIGATVEEVDREMARPVEPLAEFVTGVKELCEAAVENEFEGYWKCPHCPRHFKTEMGLKVHKGTRHKDKSAVDRKIDETVDRRVVAPLKASAMFEPTNWPFTMDWILVCRVLYARAEGKGLADIALALSDDYTKWQPEQVAKVVEVYDDSVAALSDARAKSLEDYNKKKVDVQAFVQRDAKDGKVSFGP